MKKLIFSSILMFYVGTIIAGPWPKPKGKSYVKLYEWWTVFDQHFTDAGLIDPNVTTGIFNTSLYGEYGLTDKWTIFGNATLFSRNYMNNVVSATTNAVIIPGEAINNIGDLDLGLKYGFKITSLEIPVSLSFLAGIPTGEDAGGSQGNLQTGDGEFNQMLQLDAGFGFSLGKLPMYSSAYIGINNRGKDYSEEFRYGAEIGAAFFNKKLWLTGRLNVVESFKNGATAETITSTSIFANNTEYSSYGLEASIYVTEKFGFSMGAASAFRGEIIAASPSYNVGVFLDLK